MRNWPTRSYVFFKDTEKNGNTIKSLIQPITQNEDILCNHGFLSDGHAILLWCLKHKIKVWRPYLDDDDEDRLITLLKQTTDFKADLSRAFHFQFSHDNTMIVILDERSNKGTLWSIDMYHKCLTFKSDFPTAARNGPYYFTGDDNYIVFNTAKGPKFWNIAESRFSNDITFVLSDGLTSKYIDVKSFSPNNRHLVIEKYGSNYIASYYVK